MIFSKTAVLQPLLITSLSEVRHSVWKLLGVVAGSDVVTLPQSYCCFFSRTQNVLGEKGRRIRELTAVVQKRFGFPEGSVEVKLPQLKQFCVGCVCCLDGFS